MASTSDVLKNKPSQKDLDQISKRAGTNWRSLLTQLGEDSTTVEGFLLSPSSNTIEACFKGLVHWLEGNADEPVTWETLLKALRDADMKGYADDLEKELKGPSQDNTIEQLPQFKSSNVPASDRRGSDTRHQRNGVKLQTVLTKSKVKEIVHRYRERTEDVSLPSNPKLERKYDDVLSSMKISLQSAKPRVRSRIHHKVCSTHKRLVHGVRPIPLPKVDETAQGLYMFIEEKSTFYEVFLVEEAVIELNNKKLKKTFFTEYKPELQKFLEERLALCRQNKVFLPRSPDHVHMAVVTSEEVLLSLMLHHKAYFIEYLGLQECLFEGFQDGCSVFYFAITATDAVFLALKILSHLAELKRRFSITHIVVFDHFAVDIVQGSVELLSSNDEATLEELKDSLEKSQVALKEAQMLSEEHKHKLIAEEMKHKEQLVKVENEKEMYKNSTIKLGEQKNELERQLVYVKGSLCKEHLETIDEVMRSCKKMASLMEEYGPMEQVLLSTYNKFRSESITNVEMLEEELSTSEKKMLSLRKECSQLEEVSVPTEEQKQTLHERKMALNELESTAAEIQLEYDRTRSRLKEFELDIPKDQFQRITSEKKDEIEAMVSTLQTKQTRLQGDEYLREIIDREKREASLKKEHDELKEKQEECIGELTSLLEEKEEEMTKLKETLKQAESRLALLEHGKKKTRLHEAKRLEAELERKKELERRKLERELERELERAELERIKELHRAELERVKELERKELNRAELERVKELERKAAKAELEREKELHRAELERVKELERKKAAKSKKAKELFKMHSTHDDPLKLSSDTKTETEKEYMRKSFDDPLKLSKEDTERKLKSADINGGHFVRTSDPFSKSLALSVWDKQNEKCVHFEVDVRQTKHPEYSIDKKDYFASMDELCKHYQEANLPGCNFKLCSTH